MASTRVSRTEPARPSGTAHARRVAQVLEACTRLPGPDYGPTELAAATGLHPTVVYRILQSLTPGLFVRGPGGQYRLGPVAARVGMQAMAAAAPGPEVTRPVLERLSRVLDGLAILWVVSPYGRPSRTIAAAAPSRYGCEALGLSATDLTRMGATLRMGAAGRVIAAHLPRFMTAAVLQDPVPSSAGPGTPREPVDFRASVEAARQAGYAVSREEIPGVSEVAVPVMWGAAIYGAVSILKPSPLVQDLAASIAIMREAAERIAAPMSGDVRAAPYSLAG